MKNSTQMKKKWMQFKVSALSASVTALIVSGIPTQISASDIDIYQAGGTGSTSIYMMLDRSGSMDFSEGFLKDYGYIYGTHEEKNKNICNKYYYVGPDNEGRYGPISNEEYSNWGYNSGDYKLGGNSNCSKVTYTVKDTVCVRKLSDVDLSVKFDLTDYYYVKKNQDGICEVDFSLFPAGKIGSELDKINEVKDRIKKTCTDISGNGTKYRCLSRMSKLREGLMKMIIDPSIDKTKGLALGVYSGSSAQTLLTFTEMTDANKKTMLKKIEGILASGGTPIGVAYKKASQEFDSSTYFNDKSKLECSGNGIYFMTDGEPSADDTTFNYSIGENYKKILDDKNNTNFWNKIGYQAQHLKESKFKIKTATVGLGSEYYFKNIPENMNDIDCSTISTSGSNAQSLCRWGAKKNDIGSGGFYTVQSTEDLIKSIQQFIEDTTATIEGSTMGTNTIPVDALNPIQLQNYSYFPMFKPIAGGKEQLWAGNLKKFAVKTSTGTVVDQSDKPVFKDGKIQEKLSDYWFEANGSSDDDVYMAWGGLLSKLKVHHKPLAASGHLGFNRNVYLDIGVNNGNDLKHAVADVLKGSETLENKKHYLYGLLGYSKLTQSDFDALASKSYNEQLSYLQTKTNTKDFQMASVIHSTPIMLTQKGVFEEKDGEYGVTTREDYILAGTTQGLVQVVNADNGKEVFSFLPSEFLTRTNNPQEKGFAESLALDRFTTANTDKFFYGIDGPWVAHTEYEYIFEDDKEIMTAKKQYAYGGLRMGGRSYYALDLTNLGKTSGKPKLLFAIKPDNHTSGALSYMGESWSKPVITYIPWKGQKKLAMIVGGGYDRLYEKQLSNTELSGTVKGNGIYIFAAEDLDTNTKAGTLLWWGSSNATSKGGAIESTEIKAMTHSIPSRVKAVDRNGDGITDHLYVGDLGGQVFRIDFNSKLGSSAASSNLVYQANKIADLNTTGKSPRRFYEAPTFTIHKDDNGKRFAMVTLASGDRSSPLDTGTSYPQDYVVAIKDDTVTSSPIGTPTLITLDSMHDISGTGSFNKGTHKGWFFPMPKVGKDAKHQVRAMEEGIALDNDLYYSLFNPNESTAKDGDATECTGGIVGSSSAYKFCLPYGDKTCFGTTTSTNPEKIGDLGSGIIGLTFGTGRSTATNRTLIFNKDIDPKPPEYTVSDKLIPKRWFEYLPINSGGD